jgi:hypothetical protein
VNANDVFAMVIEIAKLRQDYCAVMIELAVALRQFDHKHGASHPCAIKYRSDVQNRAQDAQFFERMREAEEMVRDMGHPGTWADNVPDKAKVQDAIRQFLESYRCLIQTRREQVQLLARMAAVDNIPF